MKTAKNILITGGSGLIGRHLTSRFLERGYSVRHLSRTGRKTSNVETFTWDIDKGHIEPGALAGVDVIIHLAGAGVADKRWNKQRKQEILRSRTESTQLLYHSVRSQGHDIESFICASGIAYYGLEEGNAPFAETDPPADDFMARVAIAWENGAREFEERGIRVAMIRTGVVLAGDGGALKKMEMPVKLLVGAPLGTGHQYVNWIHIDDLCGIYLKAVEDKTMQGAYNAVAPNPVTNRDFTKALAHALHKPLWLPPVPGFVVKAIAGDVAALVLKGGPVSSQKIERQGFDFKFRHVAAALESIYR